MLPALVQKLLRATKGDMVAIAELADQANGGHIAEFLKSSDEKLKAGIEADTRDAVLEMAKQVAYNATQLRVVIEILSELVGDARASQRLDEKWTAAGVDGGPRPDLRDVVVGATKIADAYSSTTAPLRRLYVQALRGSYAPEIYTFGFGPELLDALVAARLVPVDIDVLAGLEKERARPISLSSHGPELESYERLARGDFIEMMQDVSTGHVVAAFITHRTQATQSQVKVRRTDKGGRLLAMIRAGRGEV